MLYPFLFRLTKKIKLDFVFLFQCFVVPVKETIDVILFLDLFSSLSYGTETAINIKPEAKKATWCTAHVQHARALSRALSIVTLKFRVIHYKIFFQKNYLIYIYTLKLQILKIHVIYHHVKRLLYTSGILF